MQQASSARDMRRVLAASTAGTVIEWFDFALYGLAAGLVFNQLFFPNMSPTAGLLAAFGTFALGSFVRPLGGIVLGHLGDRVGRKPTLIFAISLMGISTMLVGALPTYNTIGIWAPVLLVVLRILQGFGAGAELAGAITYVAEYSPPRKRGFHACFPNAGTAGGLLLATGSFSTLSFFLSEEQLIGWGWRIPFLASVVILLVGLYIRQRLAETPAFVQEVSTHEAPQLPILQVVRESGRDLFYGFLSISGHNANASIVNTFAAGFIVTTLGLSAGVASFGLLLAAIAGIIGTLLFGMLADRIGRRPVFIFGALFMIVFAFPFFMLLQTRETGLIALAMVTAYGLGFGATSGAQGAFLAELFETKYRYTGIAVAREFNGVALSGLTPLIAGVLVAAAGGAPWLVALFLIGCQVLTIIGVVFARGAVAPTKTERPVAPPQEEGTRVQ